MLAQDPPSICAKSAHYAKFTVMSKLVATLVSEGLVFAYFFPRDTHDDHEISQSSSKPVGTCVVTTRPITSKDPPLFQLGDIYAIVPLRGPPQLKSLTAADNLFDAQCREIGLLYPLDMMAHIYGPTPNKILAKPPSEQQISTNHVFTDSGAIHRQVSKLVSRFVDRKRHSDYTLSDEYRPGDLWSRFVQMYGVDEKLAKDFAADFATAIHYQTYQYNHLKPLPSLQSTPIQWEQYTIEGHHYLPLSKYPLNIPDSANICTPEQYSTIFERPKVRLVAIPRDCMNIYGDFEAIIAPVVKAILQKEASDIKEQYPGYLLMPVHDMQITNIQERIPEAIILREEKHVIAYGLSSIRTVAIPGLLDNTTLKLTLGLKIGGSIRTIQPNHIQVATDFSQHIVSRLSYDRDILTIQPESAGAVYKHHKIDIAMHCSCIIRESIEYKADPESSDIFIVTAALMEKIQRFDTDETLATHVWELDTEEKRALFLDRYIDLYLHAFVPLCRDNGVVFDTHGQNTIARFDRSTGELKGFLIRDIDGIIVHRETLRDSCGVEFVADSFNLATTKEHAYDHFYSTAIDTHLQWLIRTLDMHHNGRGWQMVRRHLSRLHPLGHPMYSYLEQKEIPVICFMRTKLEGAYTEIFMPRSNLLFYNKAQQKM